MSENQKKCFLFHKFKPFGTVSFTGYGKIAQFSVMRCEKCGYSEFFFLNAYELRKKEPERDISIG